MHSRPEVALRRAALPVVVAGLVATSRKRLVALALVVTFAGGAQAQAQPVDGAYLVYEVEKVDRAEEGETGETWSSTFKCKLTEGASSSKRPRGTVTFKLPQDVTLSQVTLHKKRSPQDVEHETFSGAALLGDSGARSIELSREQLVDVALSASLEIEGAEQPIECKAAKRIFKPKSADDAPKPPEDQLHPRKAGSIVLDAAAQRWWLREGEAALSKLESKRRGVPELQFLVHLPSGLPAYGMPSALTEGTPSQVVIISDRRRAHWVTFDVTSCEEPVAFRARVEAEEEPGEKHAGGPAPAPVEPDFFLFPLGQWLSCGAPELTYSLTGELLGPDAPLGPPTRASALGTESSSAEGDAAAAANRPDSPEPEKLFYSASSGRHRVTMRPKHHLAVIAALGFDFTSQHGFSKRTERGSDPPEVTIAETESPVGLQSYIGAEWMIGGVDYQNMKWWNYFANVFVAVAPTSPLDDVLAGVAITPTGGVSLAVGVGIHKRTRLSEYAVGDAFAGDGDIPTERTWADVSPGPYVGLALDSNVYDALIERFSASN